MARLIGERPGAQDHHAALRAAAARCCSRRSTRPGEIELEIVPQGTLAERIRAGGAGIPAFFTRHRRRHASRRGQGSPRVFDGREYILEHAIRGDVALVEAWRPTAGATSSTATPGATSTRSWPRPAELTIVQTQHVAELGELSPEEIVTPGIYVDRVVHVAAGDPPLRPR